MVSHKSFVIVRHAGPSSSASHSRFTLRIYASIEPSSFFSGVSRSANVCALCTLRLLSVGTLRLSNRLLGSRKFDLENGDPRLVSIQRYHIPALESWQSETRRAVKVNKNADLSLIIDWQFQFQRSFFSNVRKCSMILILWRQSLYPWNPYVRFFRLFDQELGSRQNYSFFREKLGAKQRGHVREAN